MGEMHQLQHQLLLQLQRLLLVAPPMDHVLDLGITATDGHPLSVGLTLGGVFQ